MSKIHRFSVKMNFISLHNMTDVSTLTVRLYGQAIGSLTYIGGERSLFAFHETYVRDSERATLSLSVKLAIDQHLGTLPIVI